MRKLKYNSQVLIPQARPLLIVLSGPSGVGKDAILTRMKGQGFPIEHIVTVTTRPKRNSERENVDYSFVSVARFQEMIKNNELLEWATVYGNWYGVPKQPIKQALDRGRDAIVRVDVQGAATIKKLVPLAVFIFLMPPSLEELAIRLRQRHTESAFDLDRRLQSAAEEIRQLPMFEYVVVNRNDEIDRAVADIQAIVRAEKCRVRPRAIELDDGKQPGEEVG